MDERTDRRERLLAAFDEQLRTDARAALDHGCTLVTSDSTEFSRPILERSGPEKVSTTTPNTWKKDTP